MCAVIQWGSKASFPVSTAWVPRLGSKHLASSPGPTEVLSKKAQASQTLRHCAFLSFFNANKIFFTETKKSE